MRSSHQSISLTPERSWVIDCGHRYWPSGRSFIEQLPIPVTNRSPGKDPNFRFVTLPEWAADCGCDGRLLVFEEAICTRSNLPEWQECDWVANAYHMLSGTVERITESSHGPALSYAARLPKALSVLHDHAWVNRIFLFLRRWASREAGLPESEMFGPRPLADIGLTHDVDAIRLTPEIRLKQTMFQLVNFGRAFGSADWQFARQRIADAFRYATSRGDFFTFARLRDIERAAGLRSLLHFYGGEPGIRRLSPRRLLIDPAYDIASDDMRVELAAFEEGGWEIGLHQSFDAWRDAAPMLTEKRRVEIALGNRITKCRQHWLHFSWERTWGAQAEAGLATDASLGFNDRPGFRSGHALTIKPFIPTSGVVLPINTTPMVFMDSHFYDYAGGPLASVEGAMKSWIDEIRTVGGEATVNWHTHTITDVYRWGAGFEALLGLLR